MLPQTERLRRASLFKRIYAERKSVLSKLLTLYVLPKNPGASRRAPLVGFVVGKKVHNRAVKRNLIKRRLREAYRRRRLADPSLGQWYALAFVIHQPALEASFEEICQTVESCIDKANQKYGEAGGKGVMRK